MQLEPLLVLNVVFHLLMVTIHKYNVCKSYMQHVIMSPVHPEHSPSK